MWVEVRERGRSAGDARVREAERRQDRAALDRLAPWGPWRLLLALPPWPCAWRRYHDDAEFTAEHGACPNCGGKGIVTGCYSERRYWLFGVLAGVRSDRYPPIANPRDWPQDMSDELRKVLDWDGAYESTHDGPYGNRVDGPGDHSASWLLVAEILDYVGRGGSTTHEGFVSSEVYAKWKAAGGGRPQEWCGGVGGAEIIDNAEADRRLSLPDPGRWYTLVEWTGGLREDMGAAFFDFLQAVLQAAGDPHAARLIFNFDS
jgi:hypothetical protein